MQYICIPIVYLHLPLLVAFPWPPCTRRPYLLDHRRRRTPFLHLLLLVSQFHQYLKQTNKIFDNKSVCKIIGTFLFYSKTICSQETDKTDAHMFCCYVSWCTGIQIMSNNFWTCRHGTVRKIAMRSVHLITIEIPRMVVFFTSWYPSNERFSSLTSITSEQLHH